MLTIGASLTALSNYPIPPLVVKNITEGVGIDSSEEATAEIRQSKAYKKATAELYSFLAAAPNVSQGGMSYTFSATERQRLAKRASLILASIEEEDTNDFPCGYIGEDF